jgi:transcriptional regulator with XRE-family HTH domain
LLARLTLPLKDIAEALGVGESIVKRWSCGDSIPGARMRDKLSLSLKIPADAWFVDANVTMTVERGSAEEPGLMADVPAIRKEVQSLMKSVRDDPESPPLERAKVLASCASTIAILGKMTGDFDNNRNFLKLPAYKRIKAAMERTLKPWPEALLALGRELREIGDTQIAESES